METTVDAAIKRGRWQLFWTPVFILFGTAGVFACAFLWLIAGDTIWINIVCTLATFILPAFLCFLYYFVMLPRWRIWAFSNVRNVHELKQRAILGKIYPKDGSFLWRLEIKNAAQKETIANLEGKFDLPDVFVDDPNMPSVTSYCYSPLLSFFYLLFTLTSIAVTVIFVADRNWWLVLLLLASSVFWTLTTYKRYKLNGEPLLTISNDGITTIDNGFHPWKDIENEKVYFVSAGNASHYGVSFEVHGEKIAMSMKEITGLSSYKIDHVLRTYRGRYEAAKARGYRQ